MRSLLAHTIQSILSGRDKGSSTNPDDRRESTRFDFRVMVAGRVEGSSRDIKLWLRNVSATGVGLTYSDPIHAGKKLLLRLPDITPSGEPTERRVVCQVMRCERLSDYAYLIGAKFLHTGAPTQGKKTEELENAEITRIRAAILGTE